MNEGAIIRAWRLENRLLRGTLAQKLGMSKRMVSAIERGERPLLERWLPKLPQPLRSMVIEHRIAELRKIKEAA